MCDLKQCEFYREECQRLQRALDACGGKLSEMTDCHKANHHLIGVLRESIADKTAIIDELHRRISNLQKGEV